MTTIKVHKPGNIGTGEHRYRGTSVPGNMIGALPSRGGGVEKLEVSRKREVASDCLF